MKFTEAFQALGYELAVPRQDWSASNETGVCISMWKVELANTDGKPWLDTKIHCGDIEIWKSKSGAVKRKAHLQQAIGLFDSYIDVVIVSGVPDEGYGDAAPWIPEKRQGFRWRIVNFDENTGHFSAKIVEA